MQLSSVCFWFYQSSIWHLPYVFQRKSTGFLFSCSVLWFSIVSNAVFAYRNCLQAWWLFPWRVHSWEPSSPPRPLQLFPYVQRRLISHILYRLPAPIIGVYGIGGHTSYPHIYQFLMHTDTILQTYALIEYLERDVSINEIPSICMLLAFAPNSTDFVS